MVSDYYAMLGIEPNADRAAIEAALDRCRHQWSSGTRNPKYKHTYQSYLDQVPEIRRCLLGDPSTRAAYDAERNAEFLAQKTAKLDELQKLVRLRAAKGGLTVSDRALLRDRASKLGLTPDDLTPLIEPIPPKPEAPVEVEVVDAIDEGLDPVTRRQIRNALEMVDKRDLFDALGLPRDAGASEVIRQADSERQKWMRKSQVTAEKTAWLEVISYAQSHLANPEGRSKYERSLVRDHEESFGQLIAFAVEGLPSVDPGTRHVLLDEAAARGIKPERADRLITQTCKTLGISRDGGMAAGQALGEAPPRYIRCRSCGGVTDYNRVQKRPDEALCRHCRTTIRWDCPVCRKSHWVDEPRCHCGFEVKNLEPLIRHFEAAQHANKVRDYDGALEHLSRVQEFAPHHVGARKAIEKLKEKLVEIEAKKAEFELARSRKHLQAARESLAGWANLVDPGLPALLSAQADLLGALREAQALSTRARELEMADPRSARTLYRQALAIAADLADAREGLRRSPPDSATNFTATPSEEGVRLRWTPPAADGLGAYGYRVIRKVGSTPTQIKDGSIVKDTDITEVIDQAAPNGNPVGYAVFTLRGGIASISAATVAPFAVLLDVQDLRAEGSQGEICLSWALPTGAKAARVVRIGGAGSTDKTVESLSDHAIDRGLDDTRIYRYRVSAIYATSDGKTTLSPGIEVAASSSPPAAPAGPLVLTPELDGQVSLRWPSVPRGTVKVVRTNQPLLHPVGTRIATSEAGKLAGVWLDHSRSDSTTDPAPPTAGVCHYTPLVFLNGTATVGASIGYSCVPDPTDLRAVRVGSAGRVHLRWRWTPRASETIIAAKPGSPPRHPDDPDAVMATVSEVDYSRQGYFTLNLPVESQSGPWHVTAFSVTINEGVKLSSPGLEPSARTVVPGPTPEITVSYALRRPSFPGRPWAVTIQTDPPGSTVPPLALVTHPRTVPLSADDGQVLERFPSCKDGATFSFKPLVDLGRQRARLFADPNTDPSGQIPIRLRHPEATTGSRV